MKTITQIVQESIHKMTSNDIPLILYAASSLCGRIARAFVSHGIHPHCICDEDVIKHGKSYYGLRVISPDKAVEMYPDAYYFVASGFHAPEIIGRLVYQMNVLPTKILNFEEVVWKRSCPYLETEAYLIADQSKINFCCSDYGKQRSPFVKISNNYNQLVFHYTQYRDNLISNLQGGRSTLDCINCYCFKEGYYYVDRKIRKIFYSNDGGCNFHCFYCHNSAKHAIDLKNLSLISFPSFLSAFEQSGELSNNARLIMGAGEFTIHPLRLSLYKFCDYSEYILTNGSVFDKRVSEILANGNTALEISIDAGTSKTFESIKGVKSYQKVIENIKLYTNVQNSAVHLKYIFLPGINDNPVDVEGFIDICVKCKTEFAVISYDHNLELEEVPENTLKMIHLMEQGFHNNSILYADYSGLTKTNRYRELSK